MEGGASFVAGPVGLPSRLLGGFEGKAAEGSSGEAGLQRMRGEQWPRGKKKQEEGEQGRAG